VRRARPALGTLLDIRARGPDRGRVERAIDAAFDAVDRVEQLMSFHRGDSDLSHLNRAANGEPQTVHPWTYAVLRRATCLAALSEGLFDVAVAPVLIAEGLLPRVPARAGGGCSRDLELLPACRVFFRRPMLLDLGGIAKGFAVDQAIHALRRAGCSEALVNAGGDLRRFGPRSELIHLRTQSGAVPLAELGCGALATSMPYRPRRERMAQPSGGIVDPHRGRLWEGPGCVSVAARSCTLADALTKVAALAGPACRPLLARFGAQALWHAPEAIVLPVARKTDAGLRSPG
jgi:thiamine biosynthesis lipoprotein